MIYEQLSTHFNRKEFACRGDHCCSGSAPISHDLIVKLEAFRLSLRHHGIEGSNGYGLHINSGFRCLVHNRDIGSKDTSQHPRGTACDIASNGRDVYTMATVARRTFAKVITYDWGVHVDVRN